MVQLDSATSTYTTCIPVGRIADVAWGDHLCLVYDKPGEPLSAAAAFLAEGLRRGERCGYVADDHTIEAVTEALAGAGVDVEQECARGALVLTGAAEYGSVRPFDPAGMCERLRGLVDEALTEHFAGLRLAVDMTWTLVQGVSYEKLIEYEAMTNSLVFARGHISAICMYNRSRFPAGMIDHVVRAHPALVMPQPRFAADLNSPERTASIHRQGDVEAPGGAWGAIKEEIERIVSARVAKAEARVAKRLSFLAEAGRILSSSLDHEDTLRKVARLTAPTVADYCLVDLVGEHGEIRRVATAHRDPAKEELTAELMRFPPDPSLSGGVPEVLRSGVPLVVADADAAALQSAIIGSAHQRVAIELGVRSFAIVPLKARGRVLGAITLVYSDSGRRYGPEDLSLAEQLTTHAALAIDNARLFRDAQAEVAERRRAEAALRESEEQFRQITESIREIFWITNHDSSQLLYISPGYEEITGQPRQEVYRDPSVWIDLVLPEDRHRLAAAEPLRTLGTYDVQFRILRPDGQVRWIQNRAYPVRAENGELLRIVGIAEDITAEKRSEARHQLLSEANVLLAAPLDYRVRLAKLARLVVPALAEFCVLDVVEGDREIQRVEAAHADPAKEDLVRHLLKFPPTHERPGGVRKALRTGKPVLVVEASEGNWEQFAQSPEHLSIIRQLAPRSFIIAPLVARGRTLGALSLCLSGSGRRYDASDLPLIEELAQLAAFALDNARLHEEAKRAIRARDEVLGLVSHELRNPLQAILLTTEQLLDMLPPGPVSSHDRRSLDSVLRCARHMTGLADDLLDITRIEAGHLKVRPGQHQAKQIVTEAVQALAPSLGSARIEVLNQVVELLPEVRADRQRVQQVLMNLVGNAVRFTPEGGAITIGAEPLDQHVRFWVSDTGPGIREEDLPHVFDRFWQARKQEHGGAGLGLAISKGIVEAHGGTIWVTSGYGTGATFHFTLPYAEATVPSAPRTAVPDLALFEEVPDRSSKSQANTAHAKVAEQADRESTARRNRFKAEIRGRVQQEPLSREEAISHLRRQIQGAVHTGRLQTGDRLPSIREIADRLGVAKYDVVCAYDALEEEGLIHKRARSGAYVASLQRIARTPCSETAEWLADVLTEAREHLIRIPVFTDIVRQYTSSATLHCACVESDSDTLGALCSEAERHFGLRSLAVSARDIELRDAPLDVDDVPAELLDADLWITTAFHAPALRGAADALDKPLVLATLGVELLDTVEHHLRGFDHLTLICADEGFGERMRPLLARGDMSRVRVVLAGDRASVEQLDREVPVLITPAASEQLQDVSLRRLVPRFPGLSLPSARDLAQVMIRLNLNATRL